MAEPRVEGKILSDGARAICDQPSRIMQPTAHGFSFAHRGAALTPCRPWTVAGRFSLREWIWPVIMALRVSAGEKRVARGKYMISKA